MAKTVFEDEKEKEVKMEATEYQPRIKQMTRKIGPVAVLGQIDSIEMVDAELSAYINIGWKLSIVERIASEPEGNTFLYVLTKD
jgi:hypothetical protein